MQLFLPPHKNILRRNLCLAISLLCGSVAFWGCKKDKTKDSKDSSPSVTQPVRNIYVVGQVREKGGGYPVGKVWKNGEEIFSYGSSSSGSAQFLNIFVDESGVIYLVGISNRQNQPLYWINGVQYTYDTKSLFGHAWEIYKSVAGDLYLLGSDEWKDTTYTALWVNGVETLLPGSGVCLWAYGSDVYVESRTTRDSSMYWKDGHYEMLPARAHQISSFLFFNDGRNYYSTTAKHSFENTVDSQSPISIIKDGVELGKLDDSNRYLGFYSLFVCNDTVYTIGTTSVDGVSGKSIIYWKGVSGEKQLIKGTFSSSIPNAIFVK